MKTKTNRLIAMCMLLTMLVSLLTSLPMTAFAEGEVTTVTASPGGEQLSVNFEDSGDYTSDVYGIGKAQTFTATSSHAADTWSFGGIIVSKPDTLSDTKKIYYDYTTEGADAKLVIEYDVCFANLAASTGFQAQLFDADETKSTNIIGLTFSGSAGTIAGSKAGTYNYALEDGRWYRMRHILTATNSTGARSVKQSLYINGDAVFESANPDSSSYTKFPQPDTLRLRMQALADGSTAESATAYIDNVWVYKANSSGNDMPVNKGGLLAEIRDAEGTLNAGNYSETTKTAAQEKIDAAKAVYTSSEAADADVASAKADLAAYFETIEEIPYPGGTLLYESFTGYEGGTASATTYYTTTNQPDGTEITLGRRRGKVVDEPAYGTVAEQTASNTTCNMAFSFPTAYTAEYEETDTANGTNHVAAQGPNAQLVLEFDYKIGWDDQELAASTNSFHSVLIGSSELAKAGGDGRACSAAGIYFQAPRNVTIYYSSGSKYTFTLPEGVEFNDWHHYTLTMNLTDENKKGLQTHSFLVDGQNMTYYDEEDGKTRDSANMKNFSNTSVGALSKVRLDGVSATPGGSYLDNVSLYKVNKSNPALSIAGLVSAVNAAYANMTNYNYATNGVGTPALTAFNAAYKEAVELVTTAFGTYKADGTVENKAKTQIYVDGVIADLVAAENALKAVLPPYYVAEHTTDETTGNLTGVTVEALKDYTPVSAKLIVATYDTEGMVEASIQNFTGAGEITFDPSIAVTNKLVKVFIWEFNESSLLHLAPVYTFGAAVDQD